MPRKWRPSAHENSRCVEAALTCRENWGSEHGVWKGKEKLEDVVGERKLRPKP